MKTSTKKATRKLSMTSKAIKTRRTKRQNKRAARHFEIMQANNVQGQTKQFICQNDVDVVEDVVVEEKSVLLADLLNEEIKQMEADKMEKTEANVVHEENEVETGETTKKKRSVGGAIRQIETSGVNGKRQKRSVGARKVRNAWGHFEGTIADKIDVMISHANFTKREMVTAGGTKMSRINAHINHLRKEKGLTVIAERGGIVSFG